MSNKNDVQAKRILLDARKQIVEFGLYKGDYGTKEVGYCSLGAINKAAWGYSKGYYKVCSLTPDDQVQIIKDIDQMACDARTALMRANGGRNIEFWNDNPNITQQEVLDTFQRAADSL